MIELGTAGCFIRFDLSAAKVPACVQCLAFTQASADQYDLYYRLLLSFVSNECIQNDSDDGERTVADGFTAGTL